MTNVSSFFDINSNLILVKHFQNKIASTPIVIHDTLEIVNQLKVIASVVAGLSQNWWDSPLIAGLAYTSLGLILSLVPKRFVSKREQRSKILAALSSFESTRLLLEGYKINFIAPHSKNAHRLAEYLLHSQKIKNIFSKNTKVTNEIDRILSSIKILYDTPEFSKYVKTDGTLKTLDPEKIIVDQSMIRNMIGNITLHPNPKEPWAIELVFDEVINNPIIFPLTLWQQFPRLTFYDESCAQNLSFISHYNPRFLVAFDKAFELMNSLNNYLLTWNNFIEEQKSSSQKNYMFKFDFIKRYLECYLHLYFVLINQTININELGIKYLLEYLKNKHQIYYFFHKHELQIFLAPIEDINSLDFEKYVNNAKVLPIWIWFKNKFRKLL